MLTAFAMILFVFALFLGKETVWAPCRNAIRAWSWDVVPATVISSRIDILPGTGEGVFRIDYRYEYEGNVFGSTRYGFFSEDLRRKTQLLDPLLRQYPAKERINCYVDPTSPLEAVIDRGIPPRYWVRGVAVLAGMALGIGLFVYAVRLRLRERRIQRLRFAANRRRS